MGGVLDRILVQNNEDKIKMKKQKQKEQHRKLDTSHMYDMFSTDIDYENENLNNTYEFGNKKYRININDQPNTPSTYSSDYSILQNDVTTQLWSHSYDTNNSLYPINSSRMISPYDISNNSRQHDRTRIPNKIKTYPERIIHDKNLSKNVQFFPSHQQKQQISTFKPLTGTQSLNSSNIIMSDKSMTTATKPVRLSNRSSTHQSIPVVHNTSSIQKPRQKPIYVTIDYEATLAERVPTRINKHNHESNEKSHSNGLKSSTNNHQIQSHTKHQKSHSSSTTTTNMDRCSNKSSNSLQPKLTNSQHTRTKSLATNKSVQNIEQIPFINNEIKPSRSGESHRRHRRSPHQQLILNESSLHTQPSRQRIKTNHSNTPIMRIPLSQHNHKQHTTSSIVSNTANSTSMRM